MKSLILLTFFSCCISLSAFAQIKSKPAIGLSLSNFSTDVSEAKAQPGFLLGTTFVFGNKLYLEPGVFYATKSTEFVNQNTAGSQKYSADIKGFRVPVGVGLNILGDGTSNFDVHVMGGFSGFFVTDVGDDFEKDDFESPSWGTYAGVGIDIWKIFIDATYEWSLTNIQKDISAIDLGKSRNVFITAGFKLNFGN